MVDKITKAFKKLKPKVCKVLKQILVHIKNNEFDGLDIKKLKNRKDIFRV